MKKINDIKKIKIIKRIIINGFFIDYLAYFYTQLASLSGDITGAKIDR